VVTPAHNEIANLPILAHSLVNQERNLDFVWILVSDDSTDGTDDFLETVDLPFEAHVIKTKSSGKLISGGAFYSWWKGVDFGLELHPEASCVMKLDADVNLSANYLETVFQSLTAETGVIGGVIAGKGREQSDSVPGPVKMYSRSALEIVRSLPIATGFDVMDEIVCKTHGLTVSVNKEAKFTLSRAIGHSQGKLHGRFRNGLVCKWVGYAPEYFVLHVLRYLFRRPFFFGSIWMIAGFLKAEEGPYDENLKASMKKLQREKISAILKNPISTLRKLYSIR
jgi:hypothetical protein